MPLVGSRKDQLAALLDNIVIQSQSRSWDAARGAFPDTQWEPQSAQAAI